MLGLEAGGKKAVVKKWGGGVKKRGIKRRGVKKRGGGKNAYTQ